MVRRERNAECSDHQVAEAGYSNIQGDGWTVDEGPFFVDPTLDSFYGSLMVLHLPKFSPKTNMSSSTWMSRLRMTQIGCSHLCTISSPLSQTGRRPLRHVSFWDSGIPGFCHLRSTVCPIAVVHILDIV